MSKLLSVFFAFVHILWPYFDFCINGIHLLLIFAAVGYTVRPSGGCLKNPKPWDKNLALTFFKKSTPFWKKSRSKLFRTMRHVQKMAARAYFARLLAMYA